MTGKRFEVAVIGNVGLAHFNIPNWARTLLPNARELGVTIACDLQDVVTLRDGYVVSGRGAQGCAAGTPAGIRHFGPVAMDLPVLDTNSAADQAGYPAALL
jgi:acarbose 7IV-phosphotransferase